MNNIAVFDTSVRTMNLGDHIIMDSVYRELHDIFEESFVFNISSHYYSDIMSFRLTTRYAEPFFVGGTNLLSSKMNTQRHWKVNMLHSLFVKNKCILLGTGWHYYSKFPNLYTRSLLSRLLSKTYYHSVRDSYAEQMLKTCGIDNVLNTGCPTTWQLTPEHCSEIPQKKANSVITTITDYRPDITRDSEMVRKLCEYYDQVALWIQGEGDYAYLKQLDINLKRVTIIPPKIHKYNDFLKNNDVDFVGTRLHAGIRAMQFKRRAFIIAIDNRAREMGKDLNLNTIDREYMGYLEQHVYSCKATDIKLPIENIKKWRSQFRNEYTGVARLK